MIQNKKQNRKITEIKLKLIIQKLTMMLYSADHEKQNFSLRN